MPAAAGNKRLKTNGEFCPTSGPDAPKTEAASSAGLPRWPAGWHDHLQYHFFFADLFVQARVFLTPSLEEHSLWIFDHKDGQVVELLNSDEKMHQGDGETLDLQSSRLRIKESQDGGLIQLLYNSVSSEAGQVQLEASFKNKHVYSWLPAGQGKDAVIHRPDLELTLKYKGQTHTGRGYSKRYYGHYGPQWGYRFIQSSSLGGKKFLWTADATFRLGDGEAKYNYFKLLDGDTGEMIQADSKDTYQQDSVGYAEIKGTKYAASITPLGEWLHDYKKGETNSRMQLRYCKIILTCDGKEQLQGFALNERCFGVL